MIQNIPSYFNRFQVYYNTGGSQPPTPPGPDYSTMPVTFKSTGNTTVKFMKNVNSSSNPTFQLMYSKNNGEWTNYTLAEQISLTDGQTVVNK